MKTTVKLHIDELVLHGFSQIDSAGLRKAIIFQLTNLINQNGLPPSLIRGGCLASIDGGDFVSQPEASASTVGPQIARNIYGSFSASTSSKGGKRS